MMRIKRTYESRARGDGRRILVERLWPRGMKKEALQVHAWRWREFRRRYKNELRANADAWSPT